VCAAKIMGVSRWGLGGFVCGFACESGFLVWIGGGMRDLVEFWEFWVILY